MKIPVYRPVLKGNEKRYLCEAIDEGMVSGSGRFVKRFEEAFAKWAGTKYAVAVCNGTAALETMLWAYHPRFMFLTTSTIISCAIAMKRIDAYPLFLDISLEDGCMVAEERNANYLLVHSFGNEAKARGKFVLEDRSQFWEKKSVKTAACYSLYANKLITAGEGGVIVTNDRDRYKLMRSYRDLCHTKTRFRHDELGYNFRMSNLQAAVALAQLEKIDWLKMNIHRLEALYWRSLGIRRINQDASTPWMTLVEVKKDAGRVVKAMAERGIECRRFFYPLHRQKPLATSQYLPNSDYAWKHWLYLPSSPDLLKREVDYVCRNLQEVC